METTRYKKTKNAKHGASATAIGMESKRIRFGKKPPT